MKLCDLHCDTPYELFANAKNITDNDLHISLSILGIVIRFW